MMLALQGKRVRGACRARCLMRYLVLSAAQGEARGILALRYLAQTLTRQIVEHRCLCKSLKMKAALSPGER